MTGEGGKIIEKFYLNQPYSDELFLTADLRNFRRPILRAQQMGLPSVMQFNISFKLWVAVTKLLQDYLTTETLLQKHL